MGLEYGLPDHLKPQGKKCLIIHFKSITGFACLLLNVFLNLISLTYDDFSFHKYILKIVFFFSFKILLMKNFKALF